MTVLILVGTGLRLLYLQQPMRYDEAHSFLEYSSQPWFVTVAKYTEPNNHVGHNLFVHLTTQLMGDSEPIIRLPAFLAGVLMIPFAYLLARQFSSASAGAVFAAAVVATSSPLIEYSTNARGYTLVGLFTLFAWLCADKIRETGNRAAIIGLILSGAYGLWVIPVMLYPLSMIFTWAVLAPQRSPNQTFRVVKRFQRLLICGIGIIIFTLLLYLPILLVEGPRALIANPYVGSLSWHEFGKRLSESAFFTIKFLSRDIGLTVAGIAFLATLAGIVMCRRRTRFSLLTAMASVLIPVTLLTAQRVVPPERIWLFLIPLAAIFTGAGLQQFWERSPLPYSQIFGWGIASSAICLWPPIHMLVNNSVESSQETGAVPEAREIVHFLSDQLPEETPVIAVTPCSAPIKYYARHSELGMYHFERPEDHGSLNAQTAVLILSKTSPQTIESTLASLNLDEMYSPGQFQLWKQFPTTTLYRYGASASSFQNDLR
ncbi:MAG: glycosyltransferase family 39 protein [Planctomycetaceae bacterium]|nr:glycosyltransferase family 39 protein [Planctomycetaceae bacterium]